MLKIAAAVILGLFIIILGKELFSFWRKNSAAEEQYQGLQAEIDKAQDDYNHLHADFNYYLNPANLEKEFRARFNLSAPGEHMIIIVPPAPTSTSSTP
jgi:hypothetical protein